MQNRNVIWANNASGTAQQFLIPRENDNITYLNYGSAGFNIRNNAGTSRMFIQDGGNVGIGNTAPTVPLDVTGNCRATSFTTTSDYRIKKNVKNLDDTYNIDHLRPVTYLNTQLEKQDIGLIAHEVQEVFPLLVSGEKDGENMQSINYNGLIPILIKEIKELKEKSLEQEKIIERLSNKIFFQK